MAGIESWTTSLAYCLLPSFSENFLGKRKLIEKTVLHSPLTKRVDHFSLSEVPLRTSVFIREGRRRGFTFKGFKGPLGLTGYFLMEKKGGSFLFEGLPTASFLSGDLYWKMDDKAKVREVLEKSGLPVASGRHFWWFQKEKALRFGKDLGFPLVVKPRTGSLSRGVSLGIETEEDLEESIRKVLRSYPNFILEKFLASTFVFRGTVVDFEKVFCVKKIPACVVGDGERSVSELVRKKSEKMKEKNETLCFSVFSPLRVDERARSLLKEQGFDLSEVPPAGKKVFLQEDPLLKFGGELEEVTSSLHPDNVCLLKRTARLFDARLVGVDLLLEEASVSWREQPAAVIELNSLPSIYTHHFPTRGRSRNVAAALVEMARKYCF